MKTFQDGSPLRVYGDGTHLPFEVTSSDGRRLTGAMTMLPTKLFATVLGVSTRGGPGRVGRGRDAAVACSCARVAVWRGAPESYSEGRDQRSLRHRVEEGGAREERLDTLAALADGGVDLLELSGRTYEHEPALGRPVRVERPSRPTFEAYFAPFARLARARLTTPLAVTGGFRSTAAMEDAVGGGVADLVGLARPLILDPDLPRRILAGERVRVASASARVGVQFIDAAAELFLNQEAMAALARGLAQAHGGSRMRALLAVARRLGG